MACLPSKRKINFNPRLSVRDDLNLTKWVPEGFDFNPRLSVRDDMTQEPP